MLLHASSFSEAGQPPRLGFWSFYITYQVWNARDLKLVLTLPLVSWKTLGNSLPFGSVSSSMEWESSQLPLKGLLKGFKCALSTANTESQTCGVHLCAAQKQSHCYPSL